MSKELHAKGIQQNATIEQCRKYYLQKVSAYARSRNKKNFRRARKKIRSI